MSTEDVKKELAAIPAIDWDALLATDSGPYGLTEAGYLPKPYGRLLAEGLALAEKLFGPEVDIAPGSVIRKLVELSSLEHARTYAMLGGVVDDLTIPTATGDALSRLGEEQGLPRPFLNAAGRVTLKCAAKFDAATPELTLPAGLRLRTGGGHHVALAETVKFTEGRTEATVAVEAFHPGPEHNLDPAQPGRKIDAWNLSDPALAPLLAAAEALAPGTPPEDACAIDHKEPLTGGELRWSDARYRGLLLRAPRSVWSVAAMQLAVSLVPGVRQSRLVDLQGGLDIDLPIFGGFNFGDRVFGTERDLASPYYFTVLVAPSRAAIWDGPDGVAALVAETLEDLRPIGVFPEIREAAELAFGVRAQLVIDGVPLPGGGRAKVNASPEAQALKRRIAGRIAAHVDELGFGEPVSPARLTWLIMNETGVSDVRDLRLARHPAPASRLDFSARPDAGAEQLLGCGEALRPGEDQVCVYVDDIDDLEIV